MKRHGAGLFSKRFTKFNRPIIGLCLLVACGVMLSASSARCEEEVCAACNQQVSAKGQFAHYQSPANLAIQGAQADPAAYREEIYGKHFTIAISHLPAGRYRVLIGECETYFKQPGQRLFNVTVGKTALATNFDIIAAAGGADRVCYITGVVDHAADSIQGPLTFTFTARKNNAKFNTFTIQNAAGASLISFDAADLADPFSAAASRIPLVSGPAIWKDPSHPMAARINDLIRRMSLKEKVAQLQNTAPAIPRLGVPAYDYWSECLHGVAAAGVATVFPQAIGMAATWNPPLIHQETEVIATEARAKFNNYTEEHHGNSSRFHGLDFWSPNINIFRDPRWGRGQETYGEDPFLTSRLAVNFIQGLQGNNPKYIKAMACAKHFDVHSGPEPLRHQFDADPSPRDFYDTYLPQFEAAVREGHVGGVMGSYNAVYGVPSCASRFLLTDILRQDWGFTGYIVSDCGAIHNIWANHHYVSTPEEAAAVAVKAGCDICCGRDYNALIQAVQEGLISEKEIDRALFYALEIRFRLGLFDPPSMVPWSKIGMDQNNTPAHRALALKVAEESIVLLKNSGVLPLNRAHIKRIAVIGPNADSERMLLGNYHGTPTHPVTILAGIKAVAGPGIQVTYAPGCPIALRRDGSNKPKPAMEADALAAAKSADVVIYVGGINSDYEREESSKPNVYLGFHGGDRTRIELPSVQEHLVEALQATGKPVIMVNFSGSAMAMPWEAAHLPAIVQAWYPGEEGGKAVAEILFGLVNPAGRLPVTFYRSTKDLPPFTDYSMNDRTYRYYTGKPLYAFGHGLSYTKFDYEHLALSKATAKAGETVNVAVTVKNSGRRDGDEVVQIYATEEKPPVSMPIKQLVGFKRVPFKAGETKTVKIAVPVNTLRRWDVARNRYVVDAGAYEIVAGPAADQALLKTKLKIVSQ